MSVIASLQQTSPKRSRLGEESIGFFVSRARIRTKLLRGLLLMSDSRSKQATIRIACSWKPVSTRSIPGET